MALCDHNMNQVEEDTKSSINILSLESVMKLSVYFIRVVQNICFILSYILKISFSSTLWQKIAKTVKFMFLRGIMTILSFLALEEESRTV